MSIVHATVTVGTGSTVIHKSTSNGCRIHIYSPNGGKAVTLGGASVTVNGGYILPTSKTTEVDIDIPPGDTLYGIADGGTHVLYLLIVEY